MNDETSAWNSVRMRVKNALEEAAWPYTPQEREQAKALHAEIVQLVARADAFNRMVIHRLAKEAEKDEKKAAQLKRFRSAMRIRVELAAF